MKIDTGSMDTGLLPSPSKTKNVTQATETNTEIMPNYFRLGKIITIDRQEVQGQCKVQLNLFQL